MKFLSTTMSTRSIKPKLKLRFINIEPCNESNGAKDIEGVEPKFLPSFLLSAAINYFGILYPLI